MELLARNLWWGAASVCWAWYSCESADWRSRWHLCQSWVSCLQGRTSVASKSCIFYNQNQQSGVITDWFGFHWLFLSNQSRAKIQQRFDMAWGVTGYDQWATPGVWLTGHWMSGAVLGEHSVPCAKLEVVEWKCWDMKLLELFLINQKLKTRKQNRNPRGFSCQHWTSTSKHV